MVSALADLDQEPALHAARLLVLLDAFVGPKPEPAIEGLTKLAKLDFLLRYPVMLERALQARNRSTREVRLTDYERQSVESQMVRYRFGPWDHRYRKILNYLAGKGLVQVGLSGRTITATPTELGRKAAATLAELESFAPYVRRAEILKRHFDLGATTLMRFIYDTFPEVISLRSNQAIPT